MNISINTRKPLKPIGSKLPECEVCKVKFHRERPFQVVCSVKCSIEKAKQVGRAKELEQKKADRKRRSENHKAKRVFLENDKRHVGKQAKAYCHRWIKWRDRGLPCIACGESMDHLSEHAKHASHYRPSGMNSAIRYHVDNINLGCSRCNEHLSGNPQEYRKRLVAKIGIERVEWLEAQNHVYKWTIEELREVRDHFKRELKALKIKLPSTR